MPTHPSSNDGPPTRTRMPENPGGGTGTGTARRPRSSRNLVSVAGVVVLLIAALAFANRGGGSDAADSATGGGGGTGAQPTAPTGERPVSGKNAGIATGFARTDQGAQSAAANYAVALGGNGMFNATGRHTIVDTVYTAAAAAKLQPELDKAYSASLLGTVGLNNDGSAPSGLTFISRTVPVGTRATAYSADGATVEVWCTGLVGLAGEGSTKPVTQNWFTVTEKLRWTDGDWKITSSAQKEGPAPIGGDDRVATSEEIANAVEGYGGLTYAR